MIEKQAKFNIGDLVTHKNQGYLAIIIDIDPMFQASGRYNPGAVNRDFTQKNPWYRLLVDGTSQMTYVEEPFLDAAHKKNIIDNPNISNHFSVKQGNYTPLGKKH